MLKIPTVLACLGAVALAGCATVPPPSSSGSARPVAVGYVSTQGGLAAAALNPNLSGYTHINIAFANPDASGRLVVGPLACMSGPAATPASPADVRATIASAHRAGAKVLVSLGGGSVPACGGDWAALLRPDRRHALVRQIVALVDTEGLDGVDVDIEGALLTRIDAAGDFTPFAAELARAMHRRGKLLTCATASYEGGMIPVASVPSFDLVNVMAYDAVGPTWGMPGAEHAPMEQATYAMALWRSRGVAKGHLVLGVPFYGYGYGDLKGSYSYRDILAKSGGVVGGDVVGTRCAGCSYITFNGPDTLRQKARLSVEQGTGFMVWQVAGDTDDGSLIHAMDEAACAAAGGPCGRRADVAAVGAGGGE